MQAKGNMSCVITLLQLPLVLGGVNADLYVRSELFLTG